jgi:hypothetical protein
MKGDRDMKSLKKFLQNNNYKFREVTMTEGNKAAMVDLEITDGYKILGRVNEKPLTKYLNRYGFKWEYRGHYTALLIYSK